MTADTAFDNPDSDIDSRVIARARRRFVAVMCGVLAVLAILAGVWWLQAASRFDVERIKTEAETVRNAMTGTLSMGLPLSDFIGFRPATQRVLSLDRSVRAIEIVGPAGQVVSVNPPDFAARNREWQAAGEETAVAGAPVLYRSGSLARLSLPVSGRFGPAGAINIYFERAMDAEIGRSEAIAGLAAMVLVLSGLAVYGTVIANPEVFQSVRELCVVYLPACLIASGIAVATLFGLGAGKAVETANAYGESLGSRLGEAVLLGIDPSDLAGLDDVVREYQESNDIIAYVALLEGNRIEAATGLGTAGSRWARPAGFYDAVIEVRPRRLYRPQYRVAVGIPQDIVARLLWRTGTIFIALAAATAGAGLLLMRWIAVPAAGRPRTVAPDR